MELVDFVKEAVDSLSRSGGGRDAVYISTADSEKISVTGIDSDGEALLEDNVYTRERVVGLERRIEELEEELADAEREIEWLRSESD
jgi:hypothetical protein